MSYSYRLHGLTVHSDLELPAPLGVDSHSAPDLVIARGDVGPVSDDPPAGRIIAEAIDADGSRFCTTAVSAQRTVLRYHRHCEFEFSPELGRVTWRLDPRSSEAAASVMAAGGMLSVALILLGRLVLHASAVAVGDHALAFVGRSGMGKSTLATLLCAGGAQLISDDVLRIDGGRCFVGATETRLRPSASAAADARGVQGIRDTVDGRLAIELGTPQRDTFPVAGIVVPNINRDGQSVTAERIPPLEATLVLSRFPRVLGWRDADSARRQFELLSELAATVPVWRGRIPWGPPFRPDLPAQLLSAVATDVTIS